MNDFFTDETKEQKEAAAIEDADLRAKIQADVFEGVPAKFDDTPPETVAPKENESSVDEENPKEPVVPAEPEPTPEPTPLPPEMQAIVDSVNKLTASLTTVESRLKQTERRVGGISNEFHAAKEAAATQIKAPTTEEMAVAAKDSEAWEALKADFPSWADAINSKISAQASKFVSVDDFEALRKSISNSPSVDTAQLETRLVGLIHPDYQTITQDPAYATWLSTQDATIQHKAYRGTTAEEAIDVFNRYKSRSLPAAKSSEPSEVEKIKEQNAKRLKMAPNQTTNHKTIKQKSREEMTETELREAIASEVFAK